LDYRANGHLKSTVYRVVNKQGRERYSIPFFVQPNYDAEVACLPQFCSKSSPAKYPTLTSGMYLSGLYSERTRDFE
ncbi:unnamed protein product, partial [Scytosiphon promiscuus]